MHGSLSPYLAHVDKGNIRMVEMDGLVLFNYTDQCTFKRDWDFYTTQARGIVFEKETGKVVARPFDKFFNYSEHASIYGQESVDSLKKTPHYIQEKMDGSLGIIYYHDGKWNVATRGSFSSDQAIRAASILSKYDMSLDILTDLTLLVEIIYPENKIIVPYGEEERLVLLAARFTASGTYANTEVLDAISMMTGMDLVKRVDMTIEDALLKQKTIPYTEEGWVLVFENGIRLKIKGDDYMRIAKFRAGLSPLTVWESITNNTYNEMLVRCPEECLQEILSFHKRLTRDFGDLEAMFLETVSSIDWTAPRKDVALNIQQKPKWMQAALFSVLSKSNQTDSHLWKLLRPDSNVFVSIDTIV